MAKKKSPKAAPKTVAELTVQRVPLDKLLPHPKNPRVHPEKGTEDWEVLKESLKHDYFDPIVWNKRNGMLVSGHFRVKVLQDMNYTAADVVVVDYDEQTHNARMLAANRLLGEDDEAARKDLLSELFELKTFDMALAGFGVTALSELGFTLDMGALAPPPPAGGKLGTSSSAAKHLHLVYTAKDYEIVKMLIESAREKFRNALIKQFGKDKATDPANVLWYALEQVLNTSNKRKR